MSGILIVLIFLDNFLGPIGVLSHLDDMSLGQKISVDRSIGFTCDKFDDSVVFDCQNIEKNDIRRVQAESRRLISKSNNICEFPLCLIWLWHFFNNWYGVSVRCQEGCRGETDASSGEVDGPTHYVTSSSGAVHLNGATQLRNRLLEARGWKVLSVPAKVWHRVKEGGKAAQLLFNVDIKNRGCLLRRDAAQC